MRAISIGEVLWDIVGEAEHLGGAPFNFAVHLQNLGHQVQFVSGVGADLRGERILECIRRRAMPSQFVRQLSPYPTGTASVVLDASGQPGFVINHPAAYEFAFVTDDEAAQLRSFAPDLIYFGTLFQMSPPAFALTRQLLKACAARHRFYDVNLRANSYHPELVKALMSEASVVKLNESEVGVICEMFRSPTTSLEQFCREYAQQFGWGAVCVTRGADGCVLLLGEEFVASRAYRVPVADAIGAGDAFAAAFAHGVVHGWEATGIADFANRVGALIASRAGAIPQWTLAEAFDLQRE